MRMKYLTFCLCAVTWLCPSVPVRAENPPAVRTLSVDQLKPLVAGIAFYPDPLVEWILEASQDIPALRAAAQNSSPTSSWPESLRNLSQYPAVIDQLNRHLGVTARLGIAAKTQLADVWAAIDSLRAEFEAQQAITEGGSSEATGTTSTSSSYSTSTATGYAPIPGARYRAFVAGVLTDQALENYYGTSAPTTSTTTTSTTASTANGQGSVDQTTNTTTYPSGAAFESTTSTYEGSAQGPAGGTTTVTGTTTTNTVSNATGTAQAGTVQNSSTITGPQGNSATMNGTHAGAGFNNGTTAAGATIGTSTITGPGGESATVQGGAVAGAHAYGDTVVAGGAAGGTVTTSTGASVSGAAGGQVSVTNHGNGGSYSSQGSAGVVNNQTGGYAAGTHQASGSANTNADGSTSFQRDATTHLESGAGSTDIQHSGSGTATGNGTGTYQGSTNVQSTHGDVSLQTTASGGQATTTVTTANGSQDFTVGDQQINHQPTTTTTEGSRSQRSSSGKYSRIDHSQIEAANAALSESWGKLQSGSPSSPRASGLRSENHSFSRPSGTTNRGSHPVEHQFQAGGNRGGQFQNAQPNRPSSGRGTPGRAGGGGRRR